MKFREKSHFLRDFQRRFSLRFHMIAVLVATACSGVLASKLLLAAGLDSLAVRYPLAVLFAYLVFFLCVKLWLVYVTPQRRAGGPRVSQWLDIPDFSGRGSGGGLFRPGGGQFGGGGASASFDVSAVEIVERGGVAAEAASGVSGGLGSVVSEAAGALGEDAGPGVIIVLAVLAVLILTILGSTAYVIYEAPVILSEAAFEGFLAASLIRGAKKIDRGDWVGSIFSATWKPFLVTLLVALAAGSILSHYFPGASRIVETLEGGR